LKCRYSAFDKPLLDYGYLAILPAGRVPRFEIDGGKDVRTGALPNTLCERSAPRSCLGRYAVWRSLDRIRDASLGVDPFAPSTVSQQLRGADPAACWRCVERVMASSQL